MTTLVLTALGDAAVEAPLVAAFDHPSAAVTVVRRCVDVAELVAAATAGTAAAALVSADLRRLDAAVLARLASAGVGVVALAGDEAAERRLRGLGATSVLPFDAPASTIAAALAQAASEVRRAPAVGLAMELADPARALELLRAAGLEEPRQPPGSGPAEYGGRVVAVWGPTGAPGRTLLATTLAAEATLLGFPTLLVDADTYGGAVAQVLGLLDEAPGLLTAARAATLGTLDVPALAAAARAVAVGAGTMRVLTGMARADRWPELRATALEQVLALGRRLAPLVVVDCGFCLESDEELSYDSVAPRRNGASLAALGAADVVLAVGGADPVSLSRLVRALPELAAIAPAARHRVVVNRVRRGPVGGDPHQEVRTALERFAGVRDPVLLPEDRAAVDAALAAGRLLAESAPSSAYRQAVIALAGEVCGKPAPHARRRRRWAGAGTPIAEVRVTP